MGVIYLDSTWEELGLTSLMSVDLKSAIEDNFPLILPPTWIDDFPSPRQLEEYVMKHKGEPFETVLKVLGSQFYDLIGEIFI